MPRILDEVFNSRAQVEVLRVLSYHAKRGVTRRGVARAARLSHQTVNDCMARLESLGMVRRLGFGWKRVLDERHPLVSKGLLPLFELEDRLT
jgi:hypothetical protein